MQESAHLRICQEFGVATVWLGFPGEPVNALDLARLKELDATISALEANPFVQQVVIRSAKPAGFCAGLHPAAVRSLANASDRAAFSWFGQQVFGRIAALHATTIAFIEGPCLGAGFELALACDFRLCVAGLPNHIGFPHERPAFGGSVRLPDWIAKSLVQSRRTLSGREARRLGIVHEAFCERRAKIELRTFLNRFESRRRVPRWFDYAGLAEERRAFAADPGRPWRAIEPLHPEIALARGFITPLEFEQLPKPDAPFEHASGFRRAA